MTRFGLFTLAAAMICLSGCSTRDSPEALRTRAEAAISKGEINAAVLDLKSALLGNPNDGKTRWLLGNCYVELGLGAAADKELKQAEKLGYRDVRAAVAQTRAMLLRSKFQQVVDETIDDVTQDANPVDTLPTEIRAELIALRGTAYAALEQPEQAEAAFNEAIGLNPDEPEAKIGQAMLKYRNKDNDGARALLNEILKKNAAHGGAWSALGGLELQLQNAQGAETALTKAIQFKHADDVDFYRRALARIELKKYADAQADLTLLTRKYPGFYEADFAQGLLFARQEKFQAAIEPLQRLINANTKFVKPRFALGYALLKTGQPERAREELAPFIAAYPSYLPALKLFAQISAQLGEFAAAEKALRLVLAGDGEDQDGLSMLAAVLQQEGKFAEQTELLDRLVALNPNSGDARIKLGLGLSMAGDPTRGLAELLAARDLDSASGRSDLALIAHYTSQGQYDKATEIAAQLRKRSPEDPAPINLLGSIARAQHDASRAATLFAESLALDPGNPTANSNLASLAIQKKDYSIARKYYSQILEKHPDDLMALLRLAKLDGIENKPDDLQKRLAQAIKAHPDAVQPRIVLARHFLFSGQPERVAATLGNIDKRASTDPWILDVVGRSQFALNRPSEAAQTFEKLVKIEPKLAEGHYLLARALALSGDEAKSRTELTETIQLNPKHFGARLSLARLAVAAHDKNEAMNHLAVLDAIAARHADVLIVKADLAKLAGNLSQADTLYSEAFDLDANSQTMLTLVSEKWKSGARQEAITVMENWLQDHPKDLQARKGLASSYAQIGESVKAIKEYEKILETDKDDALVLNNLAAELGDTDVKRALEYAERAATLAPKFPAALDTAAVLQMKSGDVERARRLSDRLFESTDRKILTPEFYYHRALVLQAAGDRAAAKQVLTEGLALKAEKAFAERPKAEALLAELLDGN